VFRIDEQLKAFVESGVVPVVCTANPAGRPHVAPAWAPRVLEDGRTVDLFLDSERAARTLANLKSTKRIALTIGDPITYRSVQLKGVYLSQGEPEEDDREWVQQQREATAAALALIGDPPAVISNLWMEEVVRVTFEVEGGFDQTPGPNAGTPL
jgi:hypothetical protein